MWRPLCKNSNQIYENRSVKMDGPAVFGHVLDIEGQLSVRLRRSDNEGDIARLSLSQPLNYLSPVMAVDQYGPLAGDELADVMEVEYGFVGAPNTGKCIVARTFGDSDRLTLTGRRIPRRRSFAGAGFQHSKNSMPSRVMSGDRRSLRHTSRSLFCSGTATSDTPNSDCCSTRFGKEAHGFTSLT